MDSAGRSVRPWRLRPAEEGIKVSRLEVFFDLVFIYALSNVARATFGDHTPDGLLRGVLILALLWWCWISYVWVGNSVHAGEGWMPIVIFIVMAAVFTVALTLPEAFTDLPGGSNGPLVFAGCYFVIRMLSLVVFRQVTRHDRPVRRQVFRLAVPVVTATGLLVGSAYLPERVFGVHRFAVQVILWALAVAVEYAGGFPVGGRRWRIVSAAHWTERYELIIIVTLGELIISVGTGTNPLSWAISWPVICAAALGIAVTATLWWAYFDVIALAAQLAMRNAHAYDRVALARDGYVYLHLPMVAGIITLAVGAEDLLKQVSDRGVPLHQPLDPAGTYLMFAGVGIFLLGHLGFQLRVLGTVTWTRVGAIVLLAALTPVAVSVPALASIGILAATGLALAVAELIFLAGSRRALREAVLEEHHAHATREAERWRR
ncbi:low temperature requirement protein A [Micromonospora sp. NPDC051296]|uniref:low temperature requirement protein A n=1 Tax=Micromonospora sp. NPDC051296 TaxID=3155046 RepID=UPI0034189AD7